MNQGLSQVKVLSTERHEGRESERFTAIATERQQFEFLVEAEYSSYSGLRKFRSVETIAINWGPCKSLPEVCQFPLKKTARTLLKFH